MWIIPSVWFYRSKCKYNYLGCFQDSSVGSSYIIQSIITNYNAPQNNFVDICINYCRTKLFSYLQILEWCFYNSCWCTSTFSFNSPQTSCDTTCSSKDGERYYCGRSDYLTFDYLQNTFPYLLIPELVGF